ncbi:NAD(P)-binding protein [Microthyrium microscopicum]|uniref:NAD(P)-binding protein n=1 Tax=Microthyrium microscopicum TaxID=703497 RepID=A0A6A6UNT8_9PEZI|nr:NAD(P)-binding protein [Microthyrium microscopicum]
MAGPITVTIAGITGKFAGLLSKHLLTKPNISINGIARNPDKVPKELANHSQVRIFQANADDETALRAALKGSQVAVCCYLGDVKLMEEGQKTLIDACIAEEVPRYVAGDWSLDFRGLKLGDHSQKDPMKLVQSYLEEKEKETNGAIKGVHILNGIFMEIFFSFAHVMDISNIEAPVFNAWGTLDEPWEATTYEDAARYTALAAADESAVGFLNVLGDRKTTRQIAKEFSEVYDIEAKAESSGTLDELRSKMSEEYKAEPDNPRRWMSYFYCYYMMNGSTLLRSVDNESYPEFGKCTTFKDMMERTGSPKALSKVAFM